MRGRLAKGGAAVSGSAGAGPAGDAAPRAADLGASSQVRAEEVAVSWRPSRHARRLFTLAAAALLLAVLTRNAALAGVAGPPLLLLGMARAGAGGARAGTGRGSGRGLGRPDRVSVRIGLTATRLYEDEPAALDVTVQDGAGQDPAAAPAAPRSPRSSADSPGSPTSEVASTSSTTSCDRSAANVLT